MKSMKGFLKTIGGLAVALAICTFMSINTYAAEKKADYLPDGWKRIDMSVLSEDEITQLELSVSKEVENNGQKLPAPSLTSVKIIDLAVDERNEIHPVIQEMGTSKNRNVYWNGRLCSENTNAMQYITQGNIVVGYIRYFHSGVIYSSAVSGTGVNVVAEFTNAMSPWQIIRTSQFFSIP